MGHHFLRLLKPRKPGWAFRPKTSRQFRRNEHAATPPPLPYHRVHFLIVVVVEAVEAFIAKVGVVVDQVLGILGVEVGLGFDAEETEHFFLQLGLEHNALGLHDRCVGLFLAFSKRRL